MQSDPCRADAHARCAQPDSACACVCHKGEGTKEAWQEAVKVNLDCEPGSIAPIYISPQLASARWLEAYYEERRQRASDGSFDVRLPCPPDCSLAFSHSHRSSGTFGERPAGGWLKVHLDEYGKSP